MKQFVSILTIFIGMISAYANTGETMVVPSYSQSWYLEENKGQIGGEEGADVLFTYKSKNMLVFLRKGGISYQFTKMHYPEGYKHVNSHSTDKEIKDFLAKTKEIKFETYRMDLNLIRPNEILDIVKEGESDDYVDYYNKDVTSVRSYQKVTYKNVYPNIDWVITASATGLKYDFVVHPYGNPNDIRLKPLYAEKIGLQGDGSLVMRNRLGDVSEKAPVSFQNGKEINTSFQFDGKSIRFQIAPYDERQTLVIDPSIRWSSYYGGLLEDVITSIYTRKSGANIGNTFLAGYTASPNAIASPGGTYTTKDGGVYDAFLTVLSRASTRTYASYYGGNGEDLAFSVVADDLNNQNFYLAGTTTSTNRPRTIATTAGFDTSLTGISDGFIVRFASTGGRQWATYFGGPGEESIRSMVVRINGNLVFSGSTNSITGVQGGTVPIHQNTLGGGVDGMIGEFSFVFGGATRLRSSYYGGSQDDQMNDLAIDLQGNVYAVGSTSSLNAIATVGSADPTYKTGASDAFLVKFNTSLVRQWGTYEGGASDDKGLGCAVDNLANIYMVGETNSFIGYDATGGHQTTLNGTSFDGFISKFNTSGVRRLGSYYGGTGDDKIVGVVANAIGELYIGGTTSSNGAGINQGGYQTSNGGLKDAFAAKMDTNLQRTWGTFMGGSGDEECNDIEKDGNDIAIIVGKTSSSAGMTLTGYQNTYGGGASDAFITRICDSCVMPTITIGDFSGDTVCASTLINFVSSITNGGPNPQYRWFRNSQWISTASSITIRVNAGDTIKAYLLSSEPNRLLDTARSNIIIKKVYGYYPNSTPLVFLCALDSFKYPFKNQYFKWAGAQTFFNLRDTSVNKPWGCDSIMSINLSRNNGRNINNNASGCIGKPYLWRGKSLLITGLYTDTVKSPVGCDTIFRLNYTANIPPSFTNLSGKICDGVPYIFNGRSISIPGIYRDTLISSRGCDSVVAVVLTTGTSNSQRVVVNLCPGQFYTYLGTDYYSSTTILDTLTNASGCDSFLTIDIFTRPNENTLKDTFKCFGSTIFFNGQNIVTPGVYMDTLQTIYGCDSFITWNIQDKFASFTNLFYTVCSGKPYFFNGQNITSSGKYMDTVPNSFGCDSFITLYVTGYLSSSSTQNYTICPNSKLILNGKTYIDSGVYRDTLRNSSGCDSIVTLNISKYPNKTVDVFAIGKDTLRTALGFVKYQWYRDVFAIRWDTSFYMIPRISGTYNVVATDQNNCNFSSPKFVFSPSAIQNLDEASIKVYPIPTEGKLYIRPDRMSKDFEVHLYTIEGQKISVPIVKQNDMERIIDLSSLANAEYLIEIRNNSKTSIQRIQKR